MSEKDMKKTSNSKDIENKLKAALGNQLAIGSISNNPRLIDTGMIKKFAIKSK